MLIYFFCLPSALFAEEWSEARLHSITLALESAVKQKHWEQAIDLGESTLVGCLTLRTEQDPGCIAIMVKNAVAYYKSGLSQTHFKQIARAYRQSSSVLGAEHFSTFNAREIYYQLLMERERYKEAIPLVIEYIDVEKATNNDEYKILDRLIQLYGLYQVTEQYEHGEPTLLRMLHLTEKLLGTDDQDYKRIALTLAELYCRQKRYHEFFSFAGKHKLGLRCPSS
ncbi:MAG: hypothetical protein GYB26_09910 [Gammaproteobacteria bacterium]|nr:hypothetical protein [Gammaproteobacteria bacterium]